jgi:hypothetical protein
MSRPRTKPYAPRTVAVTGRVSEEFERQLTAQAVERQMSLSQYVHHQLVHAASKQYQDIERERESRRKDAYILQLEQYKAEQQEKFVWYGGRMEAQIHAVRHNLACLGELYQQYGATQVPVEVAKQRGFDPSHLLATALFDGQYCYVISDYLWRYTNKQNSHLIIYLRELPVR